MKVTAAFEWTEDQEITPDSSGRLRFPAVPAEPGVYRFKLASAEVTALYIGETDNLRRRLAHYRSPGPSQRTNIRMNDRLKTILAAGGRVHLAITTAAKVTVDDDVDRVDLGNKVHRRLIESAALVAAAAQGVEHFENL